MTADLHEMDCGIAGGWPHPATAHKPHIVHVSLDNYFGIDFSRVDCPYEGDVDKTGRNCWSHDEVGNRIDDDECAARGWVSELGAEVMIVPDMEDPRLPLEADPVWAQWDQFEMVVRPQPEGSAH